MSVKPPARLIEAFLEGRRFLIVGHVDPDPDAIGSVLALDRVLRAMNKQSAPLSADAPAANWDFMPGVDRIVSPADVEADRSTVLVVLDGELNRAGSAAGLAKSAGLTVNIDHHETNPLVCDVNWVVPEAPATGVLVYHLIKALGAPIDAGTATCLYAALWSDTGSFRFPNTTAESFEIAAELVRLGARPDQIARRLGEKSTGYMRLLSRFLSTLQQSPDGRIAWACLTQKMVEEAGAEPYDTEGLMQYPMMISGVELGFLLRETGSGDVRVSLRSRGSVDVSAVAASLGGGGHARAAGATVEGDVAAAQRLVLERMEAALGAAGKAGGE